MIRLYLNYLSLLVKLDADELAKQLSETFTPADVLWFDPQSILNLEHLQTVSLPKESLSFDGVCSLLIIA